MFFAYFLNNIIDFDFRILSPGFIYGPCDLGSTPSVIYVNSLGLRDQLACKAGRVQRVLQVHKVFKA